MALSNARILPSTKEKRYYTLNLIEAAVVSGTKVKITPVDTYDLTTLSGEKFTYLNPIETYIIMNERPSVHLLQKFGWYREDQAIVPIVANIPTHLLYEKDIPPVFGYPDYSPAISIEGGVRQFRPYLHIKKNTKLKFTDTTYNQPYRYVFRYTDAETLPTTAIPSAQRTLVLEHSLVSFKYNPIKPALILRPQRTTFTTTTFADSLPFEDDEVIWDPLTATLTYIGDSEFKYNFYERHNMGSGGIGDYLFFGFTSRTLLATDTIVALNPEVSDLTELVPLIPGQVINEVKLNGNDFNAIITNGESTDVEFRDLLIKRGTLIDIFYDFLPTSLANSRFYVADVKVDPISLNYVANLVPYKYDYDPENPNDPQTVSDVDKKQYIDFDTTSE